MEGFALVMCLGAIIGTSLVIWSKYNLTAFPSV